jgi:hypothetical protein
MYKVWAMLLMHHVLLARRSQLTVYCPLIQDVEFGPACGESAVPAYMNITEEALERQRGRTEGVRVERDAREPVREVRIVPKYAW